MKKKNIIINLLTDTLQEKDFEYISKPFQKNFDIFNFQFSINGIFPDILYAILEELKKEININVKRDTIIFQSNIPDLAHFTTKFYSEYVDAVIIYPIKTAYIYTDNIMMSPIMKADSNKLRLKHVYMHFIPTIDQEYLKFLNEFDLFNDVETIEKFELPLAKKLINNLAFNLEESIYASQVPQPKNTINLICSLQEPSLQKSYEYLITPFAFFLAFLYVEKAIENVKIRRELFGELLNELISNSELLQEFRGDLLLYLENYKNQLALSEFATLNYLSILLKDTRAYMRQYEYLKGNINKIELGQAHALITNSYFYETRLNVQRYNTLFKDRLEVRAEIVKKTQDIIELPRQVQRESNNIAIVAGQLLSLNHSPTKWALDYANNLRKFNPALNIKIFVEDWANYSPDELVWNVSFSSAFSSSASQIHREYLNDSIEVYYSDATLARKERIEKDIDAICNFKPSVIYKMGSKYNLATDLLFDYYPIISHTMGGPEDSDFVDIFTGGYTETDMQELYTNLNITNQFYLSHNIGIETPKKNILKSRIEYKLKETDFVLITVGNRLNEEMTLEFVREIERVIESIENYKWLIVGAKDNHFIKNKKLISNKIIFVPYEQNLFDLYHICDVYVNPIRKAGGNSAAMAMKAKIPIITANEVSDVGAFVGGENCVSLELFGSEIEKLKNDKEYYLEKSGEMYTRIESEFSFEKTAHDLEKIFERAIKKFEIRKRVLN
ncbi:glycosyltransferase [Solibacillus daqui]|uniref:glycosyltransferase n=1 Tax=Solibacillus daqui TaxID=2912187 RepID=UPI002366DC30|nr:glycosyltransferase [Solibacillus daqui]